MPDAEDAPTRDLLGTRVLLEDASEPMPEEVSDQIRASMRRLYDKLGDGRRLTPGTRLGTYEIVGTLGAGGQGTVYEGRHHELGRRVALKLADPERRSQLRREARLAARLDHPRIVRIEDIHEHAGGTYLVMELCTGGNLDGLLSRHPDGLPLALAARLCADVLEALEFAHERGIVHRDVKPSNVLLDQDGRARLGDVGIGVLAMNPSNAADTTFEEGTRMGPAGTPGYSAPEQLDPEAPIDGRADLYAFGKLLYRMLTGDSVGTIRLPSRLRPELDERWDKLVYELLEESPDDRPASAVVVRARIEEIVARAPAADRSPDANVPGGTLRRGRRALVAFTLLTAAGTLAYLMADGSAVEAPLVLLPFALGSWAAIGFLHWLDPRSGELRPFAASSVLALLAAGLGLVLWSGLLVHEEAFSLGQSLLADAVSAISVAAALALTVRSSRR